MGDGAPFISVCIVSCGRPQLEDCLESLARQVGAPGFEVLVCSDADLDVPEVVFRHFPAADVTVAYGGSPAGNRNILIDRARGEILLFLDDDVTVAESFLATLAELAATHLDVGVFGGPNVTPPGRPTFEVLQGAVLSSLVGSGPVRRRFGPHPPGEADERWFTLCNLAVHRHVMVDFDADLVCAEENGMLNELAGHGVRMWYDPRLLAFHDRRPTVRTFLKQMWKYGRGRGQLMRRQRAAARAVFLIPSLLVVYLAILPWLGSRSIVWGAPVVLYGAVVAAGAVRVAITLRRPLLVVPAGLLIVGTHLTYGLGLVRGLLERKGDGYQPKLYFHVPYAGATEVGVRRMTPRS